MSKDIKGNVRSSSVLSQGVRGPPPSPLSQPQNLIQNSIQKGYVHVTQPVDARASGGNGSARAPPAGGNSNVPRGVTSSGLSAGELRPTSEQLSTDDSKSRPDMVVQKSSLHPLLSSLGFSADEVATLLRDELLAARSGGRHEGSLADWKHNYLSVGATTGSTTEAAYSLSAVVGGTAVNNRTGAAITLRKLRVKLKHERTLNGTPTNVTRQPCLYVVIWRDKIPVSPGTVPSIHGTDSNPPSSGTLMFSQLGATTVDAPSLMVRNPITEDAYHIYDVKRLQMSTALGYGNFAAGVNGQPGPQAEVHHWEIDLHGVQQKYASYGTANSDINNLVMTVFSDQAYTGMGFTETFAFTTDVEFHDAQDAL